MRKLLILFGILCAPLSYVSSSQALDINVNLSPELTKLQQVYSRQFGYPAEQLTPVLSAPALEVPTILQIAKNASVSPLSVWELRKTGMSFSDILGKYTLPPTVLFAPKVNYEKFGPQLVQAYTYHQQYGNQWPKNVVLTDQVLTQLGQIRYFTHYLKVPSNRIVSLPTDVVNFNKIVLTPTASNTYFLPPGQAKKVGLWVPPGQAKKQGLWIPPGQAKKIGYPVLFVKEKHGHGDDHDEHHRGRGGEKHGHGRGHGKH